MAKKQRKLPLYVQVKNKIFHHVREGEWKPGQHVPSENQLMKEYNVSRTTIRQAIRDLAQQGILETRRGAPTKVRAVPETEAGSPGVFHHEQGSDLTVHFLRENVLEDHPFANKHLQLDEGESVLVIERLRLADGLPIAYQRMYFPMKIGNLLQHVSKEVFDLFPILGKHNIHYSNIKETVSASNANRYEGDMLGVVPGEALIHIERTTLGPDSLPIEYSQIKYLPQGFQYRVEIGK
ncbi:GntR family transcriptional regulator [Halobacillus litoralis]|uniref:HTH gntR-type domain-containing protein n=1 Tax=Halobacillus litoralis TaxID=45668 RepID=A0A410MEE6_9BACI|nr:GntR family transcriptional regulator [Halobacillus litoralis]QAS53114.1 hypothetical protein HLI_13415 [Halobacillus litoralis]